MLCWFLQASTLEKEASAGPMQRLREQNDAPNERHFGPHNVPHLSTTGQASGVARPAVPHRGCLTTLVKHGHREHATTRVSKKRRRRRANAVHWQAWPVVVQVAPAVSNVIERVAVNYLRRELRASTAIERTPPEARPITRTGASGGRATHGGELDGLIRFLSLSGRKETSRSDYWLWDVLPLSKLKSWRRG